MSRSIVLIVAAVVVVAVAATLQLGRPAFLPADGVSKGGGALLTDDAAPASAIALADADGAAGPVRDDGTNLAAPGAAEKDSGRQGRRVRGLCVTTDGVALRRGHIHWSSAIGAHGRPVGSPVENGEFDVVLPHPLGAAGHACAMVEGESNVLFQGHVRIDDYVVIAVRSPNDPVLAPTGRVSIWGPVPPAWRVTAFGSGHRAVLAGELGDAHAGPASDVMLTLLDVGAVDRRQGVVLQLGDASAKGPGSGIAAIAFGSWIDLVKALAEGIVFHTAHQSLDVGGLLPELQSMTICALDYGAPLARDVPIVAGFGQAIVGSPGVYGALATKRDGGRVRGEVHLLPGDLGGRSRVEWMQEEGGPESASVVVTDDQGQPVDGAMAWWRPANLPADHGYEVWGAPVDGEPGRLRVSGLRPGDHVVHVQSANGDRFAEAPSWVPAAVPQRVPLPAAGRIVLDLVQAAAFQDVLPAPELWFRTGDAWQRRRLEPPAYAPVLRGMPFGTYAVAVRAGDLVGMASVSLSSATEVARIPLTYAFRVEGRVVYRGGVRKRELRVAVGGGSMPWQSAVVGADGSYVLWSDIAAPGLALVRSEDRAVLSAWQHDPANPTVEVDGE